MPGGRCINKLLWQQADGKPEWRGVGSRARLRGHRLSMDSVFKAHRCEPPHHIAGTRYPRMAKGELAGGEAMDGSEHRGPWKPCSQRVRTIQQGGWHWSTNSMIPKFTGTLDTNSFLGSYWPHETSTQHLLLDWGFQRNLPFQLVPWRWTQVQTLVLAVCIQLVQYPSRYPELGAGLQGQYRGVGLACSICGLWVEGMWWGREVLGMEKEEWLLFLGAELEGK